MSWSAVNDKRRITPAFGSGRVKPSPIVDGPAYPAPPRISSSGSRQAADCFPSHRRQPADHRLNAAVFWARWRFPRPPPAINHIYASPCRSARQTAELLAADHKLKVKTINELQNLDHGLWHGKLVDEVRVSQPKVFRQLQDHPETVCPPQGEPVGAALE